MLLLITYWIGAVTVLPIMVALFLLPRLAWHVAVRRALPSPIDVVRESWHIYWQSARLEIDSAVVTRYGRFIPRGYSRE